MPEGEKEQFVSEPITPVPGTVETGGMARGEPGLPRRLTWRNAEYRVAELLATWKTSRPEGHKPGGELYLRRHWFRVRTEDGTVMTLYCERQARSRKRAKARWFVYSATGAGRPP